MSASIAEIASPAEIEKHLIAAYEASLFLDGLTPQDDLFDLGGDSLTTVWITAEVEERLQVTLPATLFTRKDGRIDRVATEIHAWLEDGSLAKAT